MLNIKTLEFLNKQIALEGNASATYLAMASWCERQGLKGCATFFYDQSSEERMHMMKIIHYINEMDGHAIIPHQEKPKADYDSIQELFKIVYEQEKEVTAAIYNLLSISQAENDHSTTLFLQWYVAEQREEESQIRDILDAIKLIGTGGQSLFFIDQEVAKINAQKEEEDLFEDEE
ncbi:MAG: ferritin [Saprospiraceae bacterium]|nr:ferritin [Saprospiraceae bacterium]